MPKRYRVASGSTEAWIGVEPIQTSPQDTTARPGQYTVTIGERTLVVDARPLEPGLWSILIDDEVFEVDVAGKAPDLSLQIRGESVALKLLDERAYRLEQATQAVSSRSSRPMQSNLVAPMPGRVVKVLTKLGDAVKSGQGLVVVEAMKMENEMRATRDGVVTTLAVREGQPVEAGQVMAVIE